MKTHTKYDIHYKSYAAIFHIAEQLFETAEKQNEGRLLNLQVAPVFFAFSFEAYLNHVGEEEISYWSEIERISYENKLTVISKHLGLKIDKSRRPFQTIKDLFRFRNRLAHGRTEHLKKTVVTNGEPAYNEAWRILPEETLTVDCIRRYYEDVKAAVERINEQRKNSDELLWNKGQRGYVRTHEEK